MAEQSRAVPATAGGHGVRSVGEARRSRHARVRQGRRRHDQSAEGVDLRARRSRRGRAGEDRRVVLAGPAHRPADGGHERLHRLLLSDERLQRRDAARDHPRAPAAKAGPLRQPPRGVSDARRAPGAPREGPQGEASPEAARGGGPDHREPEREPESLVHAARRRRAFLRRLRLRRLRGGIPLGEDPSRRAGGAASSQESAAALPPEPEP